MNIALINGPSLNFLGKREPHLYGTTTLAEIVNQVQTRARSHNNDIKILDFQSNHEGSLIDFIQNLFAKQSDLIGTIINPGAYSHTSIAIHDALTLLTSPIIEVHLSNIVKREPYRHHSYISPLAQGVITGLGAFGYLAALEYLIETHRSKKSS